MKIVINKCHGRFALSPAAVLRYAELKGIKLYASPASYGGTQFTTVPPKEAITQDNFYTLSMGERQASNAEYSEQRFYHRNIARNDPALVQVVEELGNAANEKYSELKVVEIPNDVQWGIHEYDGIEHVEEQHRTWS